MDRGMVRRGLALTGRQATKLLSVFPGFVVVGESFMCPFGVTFFIVRRPACVGARIHLVVRQAVGLVGHVSMDLDLGERDTPQSLNGGGEAVVRANLEEAFTSQ